MKRKIVALALICILSMSVIASVGAVNHSVGNQPVDDTPHDHTDTEPDPVDDPTPDYEPDRSAGTSDHDISDLKRDGKHYSVASARIVSEEQRVYWLEHTPANKPWKSVTKEDNGPKFDTDKLLQTNSVYLRTIRAKEDSQTLNVTVVSWNPETREVKRGNTTAEERYAANVTTIHKQVTLGPGWSLAEIDLPNHPEKRHITMWVEGHEDTARWTFEHQSVATTQPINIDTWGEFLIKLLQFVGLPVLFGGALTGWKIRNAVESAGIGPQWGFAKWAIAISIFTGLLAYGAYASLAQVIVYVPYIFGFWIVGIFGAYTLATHTGEIHTKGLLKADLTNAISYSNVRLDEPKTEDGVSADGGENIAEFGHDILGGKYDTFQAIHDEEGMSIVKPGFIAFIARIYGARARIENLNELRARFEMPSSVPDELFFVDPDADEILTYEPPGFELEIPDLSRSELVFAVLGALAGAFGTYKLAAEIGVLAYAGAGLVGLWVVWRLFVHATDGYAHIEPAPMHFRQAFASTLMLSKGVADARDLDEAQRQARLEKLRTRQDAQDELDDADRVMLEFFSGQDAGEVERPVEDYDRHPEHSDDEEGKT